MAQQVTRNDNLAVKLYSIAVFTHAFKKSTFSRKLTGPAPKLGKTLGKTRRRSDMRSQSHSDMPIIQVMDLARTKGERVQVDFYGGLKGYPVMGDEKLSGRGMDFDWSDMEVYINQYRGMSDPGGRMTQQRTVHELRSITMANVAEWGGRVEDQLCLVHLAGARGIQNDRSWTVPLETHPQFSKVLVNDIVPPSRNRHFFAGNATAVTDMGIDDWLSLRDLDRMRVTIEEMDMPPPPIRLKGDAMGEEGNDLYCIYVSPRQWHYLMIDAGKDAWRQYVSAATMRYQMSKHPLFLGNSIMWNGFLLKKSPRAIRFAGGSNIKVSTDDQGTTASQLLPAAATHVDRAIVLGGQALVSAFGQHGRSGYMANWHEEETDHGNTREISIAWMGGKRKTRFTYPDGKVTDHGVMVIDSYAPNENESAGRLLEGVLRARA